ncbi:Anb1p [Saccharomyces cerevisiae AWRI796]|nr:Anb1p [Saccharomyces cerevisiae AWRI796]
MVSLSSKVDHVRLSTCPLPRPVSTVTPRSIWLPLISSLVRSWKICLHPLTTWKFHLSREANTNCLDIDDGYLSLMTMDGETKDDVKAPEGELGDSMQAAFDEGKDLMVTIISAMGEEAAISFKEAPRSD